MSKNNREEITVDNLDLIEEVHLRIDALIEILEKKGLITEEEYLKKIQEISQNL